MSHFILQSKQTIITRMWLVSKWDLKNIISHLNLLTLKIHTIAHFLSKLKCLLCLLIHNEIIKKILSKRYHNTMGKIILVKYLCYRRAFKRRVFLAETTQERAVMSIATNRWSQCRQSLSFCLISNLLQNILNLIPINVNFILQCVKRNQRRPNILLRWKIFKNSKLHIFFSGILNIWDVLHLVCKQLWCKFPNSA